MVKKYKSKSKSSISSEISSDSSSSFSSSSSSSSSSLESIKSKKNKNKPKKEKNFHKTKKVNKGCVNVRIITPEEILKKTKEEERFINPNMIHCQDLRELIEKKDETKENEEEMKKNEKIWNSLFIKNFGSNKTSENKLTNSVTTHRKRILRYLESKKKTNFKKGDKSVAYPIKRKKKNIE